MTATQNSLLSSYPPEVAGLGEPEGTFPIHSALEIIGWLGYVLMLALTAWFGVLALKPFGENPPPAVLAMAMCVLWGLGSIGCLLAVLKMRGFCFVVFRDALVKMQGRNAQVIPWQNIAKFELSGSALSQFRIHTSQGPPLDVHAAIRNVQQLGRLIEQHISPEIIEMPELAELVGEDLQRGTKNLNTEIARPLLDGQSTLSPVTRGPQPVAATSHTITDWSTLPSYGENPIEVPSKSPFLSRTMLTVVVAGFFMINVLFFVFVKWTSRPSLPPDPQYQEVNSAIRASEIR